MNFGSLDALCEELAEINARTWSADSATLTTWRKQGADYLAPLEIGARFAFAIFDDLAKLAVEHRLVMKLDY